MLKRIAGLVFCSLFCLSALSADNMGDPEQNEYCTEDSEQKEYCSAEQIELTDSTILVNVEEGVIEVDSLLVDQGGIYYTKNMKRCVWCRRPLNPKNTCECPVRG